MSFPQISISKFTCKLSKIAGKVFKNKKRQTLFFINFFQTSVVLLQVFRLTLDMYLGGDSIKREM